MACARGCCDTPAEHYRSVGLRARSPAPKVTVDVTDQTTNTVTEHFDVERQDVHIQVTKPVTLNNPPPQKEQ